MTLALPLIALGALAAIVACLYPDYAAWKRRQDHRRKRKPWTAWTDDSASAANRRVW